jgi:diacylglycerol kinase family enzyme
VRAATVVVANSGCYGSGMRIAPDASVTDGVLDVVVIGAAGRLDLIRSLPKVYDGSHVRLPDVQVHRARHIEISVTADAAAGVPVGADGEPLPALVPGTTLTATVLPGALSHLT